MMSTKLVTLGLLKINMFWKKDYDAIISVHDVTNKILWHDSNCIVDVDIWPKFGNSSISVSFHNLNFIRIWPEKHVFWGVLLVQAQWCETVARYDLEIWH